MKLAAAIANITQLVVILLIFFIRGVELGGTVIFLLFLLMAVPFINFLAYVFTRRPYPANGNAEREGMIKREALRVHYRQEGCPQLKIGDNRYMVNNLSEGGVSIAASSETPFKGSVKGEIDLLAGGRLRFRATVLRRSAGEVVFRFSHPIGTALLRDEKAAVAAGSAS